MLREAGHRALRGRYVLWACLAVVVTLVALVVARQPLSAGLVILLPLAAVPVLYYQKPHWAIITFVVLLPFHSLLITLLVAQLHVPLGAGRLVAAWKELLLAGTAGAVVVRMLLRGRAPRPTVADVAVIGWVAMLVFYFTLGLLLRPEVSLQAQLYGMRDWMLYPLPYILGRLVLLEQPAVERLLGLIAWVGVITSVLALVEYFFVPLAWHVRLGVPYYFGSFLNLRYPDYLFGLPPNYWAEVGGRLVRRAVSVYFSAQGFALPFLLIWPIVLYRYLERASWLNRFMLAVCGAALLLTITRMTIVACFAQLVLMLFLLRRYRLLVGLGALIAVAFCAALALSDGFQAFVINTVTLNDTSSRARPQQWLNGLVLLAERPFGMGLGFSGQVGTRFGQGGVGAEAGYFKLTGDLGLVGLLLFWGYFLGILGVAYFAYRYAQGVVRGLGVVVLVITVGFLINNLTAPPDQSPVLMYVFGALAGLLVTQWQQARQAARGRASAAGN